MLDLKIGKELQSKRGRVCKLYRATYDGCRCYAIVHVLSEFVMIFEDSTVYQELVKMLRKGWNLTCERRSNGVRFYRLTQGKQKIELTQFIISKYNGLAQNSYDDLMVKYFEDARVTDNFLDFRRCNVYMPGISLDHRKDIEYKHSISPVHEEEEYIRITFLKAKNPFTEDISYELELDEMLSTPRYCYLLYGAHDRGDVTVNNGETRVRLARFVAIYKYFFGKYRGRENAVESYIKDFAHINASLPNDIEADHLNCNKHINTFENLMLVDKEWNKKKRQYINWFAGEYGVHPIVSDTDEILFAYDRINLISGEPETRYYKCKTFSDFVDWILLYLGKDAMTEKLQVRYDPMIEDEQTVILTPAGMIVDGIVNQTVAGNNVASLKEYIYWRDTLLSLPDEAFTVHERSERTPQYVVNLVLDMIGASES